MTQRPSADKRLRQTPVARSMNGLFAKSLAAFLLLPGTVAFLLPLLLARRTGATFVYGVGLFPLLIGFSLLLWCVREFYAAGRGTLAPWSPPQELVVSGPYGFSRNPMYIAVVLILAGWALAFRSVPLATYMLAVAIAFHLRVILAEEPWLERTHGERWQRYKGRVPRWAGIPAPRPRGVVAIVVRGPEVLLIRRGPSVPDPGIWGPVSGNVEPGEREADAVAREVREEVGLEVRPLRKVWESVSSGGTHDLGWWLAEPVGGELRSDSREVAEVRWCRPEEYVRLDRTFPADRRFFEEVFPSTYP